jgi:hypothetical protein
MMRRRIAIALMAAFAAGCFLDPDSKQARGSVVENEIAGVLLGETGAPAVGARVTLAGAGESAAAPRETVTDSVGHFRFAKLPEGSYSVLGRHDTLLAFRDTIAVKAAAAGAPAVVKLDPDTLRPTGGIEVRVTLRPGDDPASVTGTVLGTAFSSHADATGDLSMGGMPRGRLRVRFVSSLPGYRALEVAVDVAPGLITRAGTLSLPTLP